MRVTRILGGLIALLESSLDLGRYGITFARLEQLTKAAEEFGLPGAADFLIGSLVVGHLDPFPSLFDVEPAIGAQTFPRTWSATS